MKWYVIMVLIFIFLMTINMERVLTGFLCISFGKISIHSFLKICLFMPALGLRCCLWAFSSCSERGLLFVEIRGLIAVACLVAEHGL